MKDCPDKNPLQRDGLSQFQRRIAALQPEYIAVDERKMEDLLQFAAAYAKDADPLFYDLADNPDADVWTGLMDYAQHFHATTDVAAELASRHDFEPHFALFLCFLELFALLRQDINTLTKRHLDFYYQEVLRLDNRAPVADRVHVLFTLAKNALAQIIAEGTELDAGKDALRQPLIYPTTQPLTVNTATIGHLRSVFLDKDGTGKVYFAPVANTIDGIAKPLDAEQPTWNAFGPKPFANPSCTQNPTNSNYLPEAKVGFAIASPVLLMAEGEREVTIKLTVTGSFTLPAEVEFDVEFSGKKAWISQTSTVTSKAGNDLILKTTLDAEVEDAVVAFDPFKLDGGYSTNDPVLRCWLRDSKYYRDLREVRISLVHVEVSVKGLKKALQLSNDFGGISPEKPFMPFGPTPVTGSAMYVNSPEMNAKRLQSITVQLTNWVGKPQPFSAYYAGYESSFSSESNFTAIVKVLRGNLKNESTAPKKLFSDFTSGVQLTRNIIGSIQFTSNNIPQVFSNQVVSGNQFVPISPVPKPLASASEDLLKITLQKDFGHGIYAKLLSEKIIHNVTYQHDHPLPNTPYTPMATELLVSYTAVVEHSLLTTDFTGFSQRPLQFFHLGIFGTVEEHAFKKQSLTFLAERNTARLLPYYGDQGTFLIGLQQLLPQEAISLLFQVAEGSANPERPAPLVVWSILAQNQWRKLSLEEVLSDTTNNLLTSGITKFLIPNEATTDNTLLDANYIWLKAELQTDEPTPLAAAHDSVSNLVAVHPHAVLARFSDRANDQAHYDQPLAAGTIKKSRSSLPSVKTITQPYSSFGGAARESDAAFYIRVSERLRHKQRAVAIWDYEHLVLQTFPTVFKTKCLNHTRLEAGQLDELAPGHVTLVVLPDLRNANAINPLEPKVDLNTLDNIWQFLQKHAAKFVSIRVTNPRYERVRFKCKVQLARGYEPSVYLKKLNEDLVHYLSPWAFNTAADIPFGGIMEKSVVINFMERLTYVDFLTDVEMVLPLSTQPAYDYETIQVSNPMAVLVSCSEHDIQPFVSC